MQLSKVRGELSLAFRKRVENLGGIRGKGYIFKALGQAWLREDSFIDFVWRYILGTFRG